MINLDKNMKISFWIGMAIGLLVFLWPSVTILRVKKYTEAELENISPKYRGINKAYLRHGILGAVFFIPFLLFLFFIVSYYDEEMRINLLSAFIVVALSYASVFFSSFAVKQGVYPRSKYFGPKTTYAFDVGDGIGRVGRIQQYISVVVGSIAMVVVVVIILANLN
jgi:MFS family permease